MQIWLGYDLITLHTNTSNSLFQEQIYHWRVEGRVFHTTVLVLLPIVSETPFEYPSKYQRYFPYAVLKWVSAIFFTYFWQYSIPIHLSSGALVNSVNNTIVTERVKTIGLQSLSKLDTATVLTH